MLGLGSEKINGRSDPGQEQHRAILQSGSDWGSLAVLEETIRSGRPRNSVVRILFERDHFCL
jgi:hypothetical protein